MIGALIYLLTCSMKNRLVVRLKKLQQVKYLVSVLAGLGYIGFLIWSQKSLDRTWPSVGPGLPAGELHGATEVGFGVILLVATLAPWIFPNNRTILFNDAEILHLFPAPIRRNTLFNYRIIKAQAGILFAALISAVIFGRGGIFPRAGYLFVTVWTVYVVLFLYRIAVILVRKRLQEAGISGKRYWQRVTGPLLAAVILVAAWTGSLINPPAMTNLPYRTYFANWLTGVAESGPSRYVLFPFRMMVRPALASDMYYFLESLAPVIVLAALLYASIQYKSIWLLDAAPRFKMEPRKLRQPLDCKPRKPLFRLSPHGMAFVAIYWKNLASSGFGNTRYVVPVLGGITILLILVAVMLGEGVASFIGAASSAIGFFFAVFGPVIFRDDLRTDLENIDLLKTYPVRGRGIILGEVLAPGTLLAMLEWACILIAAVTIPAFVGFPLEIMDQIFIGFGALVLLPCLSFMGILIQNAAVLILPGWVQVGRKQPQGVEAIGQRLLSSLASLLFLLVAALPAALFFFATVVGGYGIIGTAIVPLASLAAALALCVEAGLVLVWLGGCFDRFDPSREMPAGLP